MPITKWMFGQKCWIFRAMPNYLVTVMTCIRRKVVRVIHAVEAEAKELKEFTSNLSCIAYILCYSRPVLPLHFSFLIIKYGYPYI